MHKRIPLKTVVAPGVGAVVTAPPPLTASTHTVDYTCGFCSVTLMHAEEGQVYGLLIHCAACGTYNKTEG